jgi:hypothetical protein
MQTQVVHQRKVYLPWIPMLVAALLVAGSALGIQLALRDRGTTVTPPSIATVDQGANQQKADMTAAGITGVGVAPHHGAVIGTDIPALSGPHPRVKFSEPETVPRDEALNATITRIQQAR